MKCLYPKMKLTIFEAVKRFFFKSTMVLYTQETRHGNVSFVRLINFKVLKAEVKRTRNLEG